MRNLLLALFGSFVVLPPALGNPAVCDGLGDYAITAAALAKQEKAGRLTHETLEAVLVDMYFPEDAPSPALASVLERIRNLAAGTRMEPSVFATDLVERCVRARAIPGLFLGSES